MKVSVPCAAALTLFPLVSAFPAPTAAPGELDIIRYGLDVLEARRVQPRQLTLLPGPDTSLSKPAATSSASSQQSAASSSSSSSAPPSSSSESKPPSTPAASSTPPTIPPSSPPIIHTSTSKTQIASTQEDGQVITITKEVVVSSMESPSATPAPNGQGTDSGGGSGVSTSTIIGLSVAGGLTALCAIAFIAWKLTRKRFSQFDSDDGVINWPNLQKDPAVVAPAPAPRPAPSAASTTTSTVDLAPDPYAVPPLPQPQTHNGGLGPYRDDPSAFYDPYRGPVPQTFATPPVSMDGHSQGWAGGEAIPMSTYSSGRTSPGPNFAYGGGVDPMQRIATPVQRMATPVQRMATPVGGATFQEIARAGTPGGGGGGGGGVPYRTGTPGYGYGGR